MIEEPRTHSVAETDDDDEINLLELLLVIVRRKLTIVLICSVAMVLSACYSLTLKNIYTATSKILPPPREFSVGGATVGPSASGASAMATGQIAYLELYITIGKSRSVLDAVIKHLDLQTRFKTKDLEATRRMFSGAVKFQYEKDGTIAVSANNRDPKFAALLANTFVEELGRRSAQLYITKAATERYILEKRLRDLREELNEAEGRLRVFQEKNKTLKADAQASVAIDGVARLRFDIVNKEVQLAALRNSMTDESSEVKVLQAAIAKSKAQLGAMSGSGSSDTVVPATGNVPRIMIEFGRLSREVKTLETVFEQLSKQYEIAKVNESRDSGTIQVIDEAIPPTKKSKPLRKRIVLISTVAGFFVSIVVIFLQEKFSKLSPKHTETIKEIKQSLRFRKRAS